MRTENSVICWAAAIARRRSTAIRGITLAICLGLSAGLGSTLAQQSPEQPLTNSSVIKLVRAGFKEKTVIAIIHSRQVQFNLAPDRLIELKRAGVSERIILAMIGQDDAAFMNDDLTFDDFKKEGSGNPGPRTNRGDPGVDIFGSNGGSRNQSNGRGESGANEGSSLTTGSASVHILRPPSEAGGVLRLERTPTLTNQSIIQMVEAGFSEGTIIRRIEQSPAEFNLSSPEITELQKHRVTAPVIAAMKAAMSDDPTSSKSPAANNPEK
ncbi:MAG: hypothetical protein QOD75_2386 [Blastocatellia bacterium]|jgi:hypothetical protein|nr:hypothetical protein [Blastocatellia bacterium]